MDMKQFIDTLNNKLQESGLSMRELSLKSGLEESAVKQLFYGRTSSPKIQTIASLAKGLNCTPLELLPDDWKNNYQPVTKIDSNILLNALSTAVEWGSVVKQAGGEITEKQFAALVSLAYENLSSGKNMKHIINDSNIIDKYSNFILNNKKD